MENYEVGGTVSVTAKRVLSGDDYAKCQRSFGVKREVIEVTDEDTDA